MTVTKWEVLLSTDSCGQAVQEVLGSSPSRSLCSKFAYGFNRLEQANKQVTILLDSLESWRKSVPFFFPKLHSITLGLNFHDLCFLFINRNLMKYQKILLICIVFWIAQNVYMLIALGQQKRKWEERVKDIEELASQYQRKPLCSRYRPLLSKPWQPSSIWKLFHRQIQAFNFAKNCKEVW